MNHSSLRPSAFLLVSGLLVISALCPVPAQAAGDVYDQFFRYTEREHKVLQQELPGEAVDPFTGILRIVQSDLVLPGKAGLDLKIVRSYHSKIWGRSDLLQMEPLLAEKEHSVLGYGWDLQFGRIKDPNATGALGTCGTATYPVYEAPDGTARIFYPMPNSSTVLQSRDFWRMERNCSSLSGAGTCIWSDTGTRYEFSNSATNQYYYGGTTPIWPVSAIVDPFGNRIAFSYLSQSGAVSSIADTYNRSITFSYHAVEDCPTCQHLDSINANGSTYTYLYTKYTPTQTSGTGQMQLPGTGREFLTEMRPPVGPSSFYQYAYAATVANNQYALSQISYPSGGSTSYSYATSNFFVGNEMIPFAVLSQRVVGGRGVTSGTWTYSYVAPGAGTALNVTTITRPDGRQDQHTMYGLGYVAGKNAAGYAWLTGLTQQVSRASGAEIEALTWATLPATISNYPYAAPSYSTTCTYTLWDNAVYVPVVTQRSISRDGATYTTSSPLTVSGSSNFDTYGQALTVTESGQQSRTTVWSYFSRPTTLSGATLNMVRGFPLTQHVCAGTSCTGATDTFDNSWTYNGPNFARDSETRTGVKTTFGYDSVGNLSTVTNALNETLTLSGYDLGMGVPTSLNFNNAFSHSRTTSWEGWIKSETDGRGKMTSYDYDAIGRLKTLTPPGTTTASTYSFAPDGSSSTLTRGTYSKVTSVDGLGRLTTTSDSEGIQTSVRWDNMGRAWFKSYPYDSLGVEVGDAQTTIDGLGRPTVSKRAYRPGTSTCDDSNACMTTTSYSSNSLTTTVQRASGDSTATTRYFTSYGSPNEQRLTKVTDANSKVWQYAYNIHGDLKTLTAPISQGNRSYTYDATTQFLTGETNPEGGTTSYGPRNAIGQVTTRTDARTIVGTYGYNDPLSNADPLSRLRSITFTGPTGSSGDDVLFGYDNANNLTSMSTANGGSFIFGYDELNRTISTQWTLGASTFNAVIHYNSAGCLDSMTYPTGTVLTIVCDTDNRPTSIKIGTSSIVSSVAYHPSGGVKSMSYGNATSTSSTFDDRARLKTSTATGIIDLLYGYDGADNVKSSLNNSVAGSSRTMTYDALDRLSVATAPSLWGAATYTYDELGNRKLNSYNGFTANYTYDTATNRLAFASAGNYRDVNRTFTWSRPGRLGSSSDGSTYYYDGRGRRVQKTDANGTTLYHYDSAGLLISETTATGSKLRDYIYLDKRLIAVDGCISNAPPNCTERQWYHTDALGSVLARTDTGGAVVARFDYAAWGEQWTTPTVQGDRQFNGRVYDATTGFHDYGARMYWPQLGRFISPDEASGDPSRPSTYNKYSYVQNAPYNYTDPSGRSITSPWFSRAIQADNALMESASPVLKDPNASFLSKLIAGGKVTLALLDLSSGFGLLPSVGAMTMSTNAIIQTEEGLAHIIARHTVDGAESAGKSLFAVGEKIPELISAGEHVAPVLQKSGNLQRVVDGGRIIGFDRTTGQATSIYTIITNKAKELITAFPGKPGSGP